MEVWVAGTRCKVVFTWVTWQNNQVRIQSVLSKQKIHTFQPCFPDIFGESNMVYLSEMVYCAFTFLCNEDSLFTKPGFLLFQLRPKANITGKSKGLLLMCRNYNNLANVTVLFIHECFYNVLSCALVPVLGYRKYLVSLKSKNIKNHCFYQNVLQWLFCLSWGWSLFLPTFYQMICRVDLMQPTVSSPMNATLVSCFSLPECRDNRLIHYLMLHFKLTCIKVVRSWTHNTEHVITFKVGASSMFVRL